MFTFVMGDLCCLLLEYPWILEQNGVLNMSFMPITHPIVLFNVASVKYLEKNWLTWVSDLLCASSMSQNHGSNKLMIQSRKCYPGPHLFFAKCSRDHYILPGPALKKKVLFMAVPKTYPATL